MQQTLTDYKKLLDKMSQQYAKTIADANAQMQQLLLKASEETKQPEKPDSAWIEKDGDRYLLMNKAAVDHMNGMFEQFKGVIEELMKQEAKG